MNMYLEMITVNILHSESNHAMAHDIMEYITVIFYENFILFYLSYIFTMQYFNLVLKQFGIFLIYAS